MITIDKVCPVCAKQYSVRASIKRPLTYCSMDCRKVATARNKNEPLTIENLRLYLHYDPDTGIFTHKKNYGVIAGSQAGWSDDLGYIHIRIKRLYLAHRLAWFYVHGEWPKDNLDHINGNPADNRIVNLRNANQSQNMRNTFLSKANRSGRKGVCWDPSRSRWRATIRFDGNWKQIGRFKCFCSAIRARTMAEKRWHGDFSRGANA